MLGICRGIQTLAMALDGEVMQDIESESTKQQENEPLIKHSQDADRSEPTHTVAVVPDSILHSLYFSSPDSKPSTPDLRPLTLDLSPGTLPVNSFHHQAVRATASGSASRQQPPTASSKPSRAASTKPSSAYSGIPNG